MIVQGQSGPVASTASIAPGTQVPLRQGNMGDAVVSELHGRYYESAYRGSLFGASAQAALATTAAFALAYTGLCLSNPNGSGKNLVINKAALSSIVAQTSALAVGIMVGSSATAVVHTTPATVQNALVGQAGAAVGCVDTACTLPVAPVLHSILGTIGTGATTVDQFDGGLYDLEGSIVLAPGAFACFYTNVASVAASLVPSIKWEEVPV